jgi:tetratricopeptide (TPR) repeat protein
MDSSLRRQYARLYDESRHRFNLGDLDAACELLEQAVGVGRRLGDDELFYRAKINLFSIGLEVSRPSSPAVAREVLLQSRDPLSRYLVSSALARVYQATHQHAKALFYARAATAIAPEDRRATAAHTLGVSLLSAGDYGGAIDHILGSLDDWPHELAPVTLPLSVLSYASALLGRTADSIRYGHETEGLLPAAASPVYDGSVNLNLGYAALEREEADRAYLHGAEALLSVSHLGQTPSHEHKSALYLLGQSALGLDRLSEAESSFQALSRTYYPKDVDVSDLLMILRTSSCVNWLA